MPARHGSIVVPSRRPTTGPLVLHIHAIAGVEARQQGRVTVPLGRRVPPLRKLSGSLGGLCRVTGRENRGPLSRRLISGRHAAKAKKSRPKGGQMLRKSPVHGFPSLLVIEASGFENCHGAVVGRDAAISLDLMPTNAGSTAVSSGYHLSAGRGQGFERQMNRGRCRIGCRFSLVRPGRAMANRSVLVTSQSQRSRDHGQPS